MRAIDILDKQVTLIEKWKSPAGLHLAQAAVARMEKIGIGGTYDAEGFRQDKATGLNIADTYWVTSEMCDLVTHAAPQFKPQHLLVSDMPSKCGFIYFDKNIYLEDEDYFNAGNGDSYNMPARAIWYLVDTDPDTGPFAQINMYTPSALWDEIDPGMAHKYFGELIFSTVYFLELGKESDYNNTFSYKLLSTLFVLMNQRIAVQHREQGNRATDRRIKRARLGITNDVLVVNLRREASPQTAFDEGKEVMWSHRWMVDGHWRNQYFPSIDDHRQIWIAPHVKGPDHLPLFVKDKVYKWRR